MKILVLNGSPHLNGNTAAMVEAFVKGAGQNGHDVTVVPVCCKHISGCKACEYCHTKGDGKCIQPEDMGIFTAFDKQNKSVEKLDELMQFGKSL